MHHQIRELDGKLSEPRLYPHRRSGIRTDDAESLQICRCPNCICYGIESLGREDRVTIVIG